MQGVCSFGSYDCTDTEWSSDCVGDIAPNTETCDTQDNDCDFLIDDSDPDVTGQTLWYNDAAGDGYGNPDISKTQCFGTDNYVPDNTDVDDSTSHIRAVHWR